MTSSQSRILTILGDASNVLTRQAADVANLTGYTQIVITEQLTETTGDIFITIEDNREREQLIARIGQESIGRERIVNLIHPTAHVSISAKLGCNIFVGAQAIVGMEAVIGDGVTLNALSSIEHDNVIGDFTFLGTGAILCGRIETGREVFVGGGATIKPGTRIGAGTTIGTGAVLVKDADPDSIYVGNPARKLERPK